jgi:hypothetical protein
MEVVGTKELKNGLDKGSKQNTADVTGDAAETGSAEPSMNAQQADKRCSVNLYGCPLISNTLKATFPNITRVVYLRSHGKLNGVAAVFFPTVSEAEQFAQKGTIEVGGKKMRVQLGGEVSAEEKARRKAEERTRTVYFFGCSPDLKTLWNQFPDAEQISFIQPPGPSNAHAAVCFATVAEAEQLAQQKTVMIEGRQVRLSLGRVETAKEKAQRVAQQRERTVFLPGCPPELDKIRQLFPTAENVAQYQPWGQVTDTVIVMFGTAEEARKAAEPGTIQIDGKTFNMRDRMETVEEQAQRIAQDRKRTVHLLDCPPELDKIRQMFPTAEKIDQGKATGRSTHTVTVRFGTVAEAEEVAQRGTIQIDGKGVRIAETPESLEERVRRLAEQRERSVFLEGCTPTEDLLWNLFPNAEFVKPIMTFYGTHKGISIVRFATATEAQEVAKQGTVQVGGKTATVYMADKAPKKKKTQKSPILSEAPSDPTTDGKAPKRKEKKTKKSSTLSQAPSDPPTDAKAPKKRKHTEPDTNPQPPLDGEAPKKKKTKKSATLSTAPSETPSDSTISKPLTKKKAKKTAGSGK